MKSPAKSSEKVTNPQGLHIIALTALVVGSMIGGGIFGMPSQMARSAAAGPLIIGWIITGVGMLTLALSFQSLAKRRPEVDGGVYGYARAGFGDFVGYCSAIGYWIGVWIGNVGFLVLLMSSLGTFFPIFEGGNTVAAVVTASIVLWVVHFLVLRGVREAAGVNVVVTIAKVIPLVVFVLVAIFYINPDLLSNDWWGISTQVYQEGAEVAEPLGSTLNQIVGMMLITVWVFSGVEGAAIFSKRARTRRDVGRATVGGFLFVLALLIAVNLLSYATVDQAALSQLEDPSLANVFGEIVGPWGAKFISIGLIISLAGVLLSWVLLSTEILRIPSVEGVIPAKIGELNKHGTPAVALWVSNICVQVMLVWTMFSSHTYEFLIILASGTFLIPYLFVALYQVKSTWQRRGIAAAGGTDDEYGTGFDLVVGVVATVYAVWLIYAGGLIYLLGSMTAYFILSFLFVWARKEGGHKRVFKPFEWGVFALLAVGAILFVVLLSVGYLEF